MNPRSLFFQSCALSISCVAILGSAAAGEPAPTAEILSLVKQLGSDSFDEREAATRRLNEIGEPALDALYDARSNGDPEVRRRAENIIAILDKPLCLTGHTNCVWIVSLSADGKRLLTCSGDATLRLWDADTGKQLQVFAGHTECIVAAALSPDGKRVLSGSGDKTVRLWDAATGKQIHKMVSSAEVYCVAFGPEGKGLSGGNDQVLTVWDLKSGEKIATLKGHQGHLRGIAYSESAKYAATSSADRTIRLWDLGSGKEVRKLTGHREQLYTVCYSPDGKRLLSAGYDHTARVWDVATGKELKRLRIPEGICAAFSPDCKRIVTGGIRNHHVVSVWEIETGRELRQFEGHVDAVTSVAFFPDGKRIVSSGDDGVVRIWRAPR